MTIKILFFSFTLIVTGCTAIPPQTPPLTAEGKSEQQKARDVAECLVLANRNAPVQTYIYQPPPPVYGGNFSSAMSGFSHGAMNSMNMIRANDSRKLNEMIHKNCLISKGWKKAPTSTNPPDSGWKPVFK